jgi:hypothetical protein
VPTVRELVERFAPAASLACFGQVFTDTTEFMRIGHGDVMALAGRHYLVLRDEAERRFGLEDPKFWVKRCIELETGAKRIVKLVFHESFPLRLGAVALTCYRSPDKEARILDLVRGDPRFMQGENVRDEKGNMVRVLDLVAGRRLDLWVENLEIDHATYFREVFPGLLARYIKACEAIRHLHRHHEIHGDIRRDHLFTLSGNGGLCWIDFDYAYDLQENPFGPDLFGLGNILLFLVGKGIYTLSGEEGAPLPEGVAETLTRADFSLMYPYRVMNLKKVHAYIPDDLNRVLLHYSVGANVFYESIDELLDDLSPCLDALSRGGRGP